MFCHGVICMLMFTFLVQSVDCRTELASTGKRALYKFNYDHYSLLPFNPGVSFYKSSNTDMRRKRSIHEINVG